MFDLGVTCPASLNKNEIFQILFDSVLIPQTLDYSINNDTIIDVATIKDIVAKMKQSPKGVRFNELCKVCDFYFGEPRQSGSSHCVYKTPWHGDPRVNIQNAKGKEKLYQVRQVLAAIQRLEVQNG